MVIGTIANGVHVSIFSTGGAAAISSLDVRFSRTFDSSCFFVGVGTAFLADLGDGFSALLVSSVIIF